MAKDKRFDAIIIGGFGHVGLPLGIVLADSGLRVGLQDINMTTRPQIESGKMPFIEYDAEPLLKKVIGKNLTVCDSLADVRDAKTLIITIGTPVDEYLGPKAKLLFQLADDLLPHLTDEHCLLLRSTVYPGTTRALAEYLKSKGCKAHVGNCPERIVQGYAIRELKKLPQIISGVTKEAAATAEKLFGALGVETIEVSVDEAELCKLFLNAWRYIQFAAANQFYMTAVERGLNYDNIHYAMTHNYERAKDLPGPGFAAGPCLFKDTMQLAAADRGRFPLGFAAMQVNEGLPAFVVRQMEQGGIKLRGETIGILGMAFKAEIDDPRDSLSYKVRKILQFNGANVLCSDEYIRDASFVTKEELVKKASAIVVGVPHKAYKSMKIPAGKKVIDLWGTFSKAA